jgi:hypothetical protein
MQATCGRGGKSYPNFFIHHAAKIIWYNGSAQL